jgi:hypothetical protein
LVGLSRGRARPGRGGQATTPPNLTESGAKELTLTPRIEIPAHSRFVGDLQRISTRQATAKSARSERSQSCAQRPSGVSPAMQRRNICYCRTKL